MKAFQVSPRGTPKSMLWQDSQMLKIKWRIIQLKIRQVAKTMVKLDDNVCKEALIAGGRPPYRIYEHMQKVEQTTRNKRGYQK